MFTGILSAPLNCATMRLIHCRCWQISKNECTFTYKFPRTPEILDVDILFDWSTYSNSKIVGSVEFLFIHFLSMGMLLPSTFVHELVVIFFRTLTYVRWARTRFVNPSHWSITCLRLAITIIEQYLLAENLSKIYFARR